MGVGNESFLIEMDPFFYCVRNNNFSEEYIFLDNVLARHFFQLHASQLFWEE